MILTQDIPPEQAALLLALVNNPKDDTIRLVYSDWLEEHDDKTQADFIRASIRLGSMDSESNEYHKLDTSLYQQWIENRIAWLKQIGISADPSYDDVERGCIQFAAYFSIDEFLSEADLLLSRAPIRALQITPDNGRGFDDDLFKEFGAMPSLSRIETLLLDPDTPNGRITADGIASLINSPNLRKLRTLFMCNLDLRDEHAMIIAGCENLPNLRHVELDRNPITPVGALAILRSKGFSGVEQLTFRECPFLTPYYEGDFAREIDDPEGRRELMEAMEARFGKMQPYHPERYL